MRFPIIIPLLSSLYLYVQSHPTSRNNEAILDLSTRLKRSLFTGLFENESTKIKILIFSSLYGFFIILSVIVYLLYRHYKAKKRRARPVHGAQGSNVQERVSLRDINGSEETIGEIPESRIFRNNETTVSEVQCPKELSSLPVHEKMEYISYDTNMELHKRNLKIIEHLGAGCFGSVYLGLLKKSRSQWNDEHDPPLNVAVKKSLHKYDPTQEALIEQELKLMCQIKKHPNVLALIGAVTPAFAGGKQTLIVSEYVDCGDLLQFLQKRREIFVNKLPNSEKDYMKPKNAKRKGFGKKVTYPPIIEDSLDSLNTFDLLSFAYQIAHGMEYLTRIPLVHRDLALRNILINSNKVIRIADFGLARQHKGKEYYRIKNENKLPILYVSPECFETEQFTEKSDIWSFGICLFEIFSLGDVPYKSVTGNLIEYLINGNRLDKPQYCHKDVYNYMRLCWSIDPVVRPKFENCLNFFEEHLGSSAFQLFETIDAKLKIEAEKQRSLEVWTKNGRNEDATTVET